MPKPKPLSRQSGPAEPIEWVSASEIGAFAYCARAWWYRHTKAGQNVWAAQPGARSANRRRQRVFDLGAVAHERHHQRQAPATFARKLAVLLIVLGLLALAAALSWRP